MLKALIFGKFKSFDYICTVKTTIQDGNNL